MGPPTATTFICSITRVIRARFSNSSPRVVYTSVPAGQPRVMIETSVSRTWRPSDHASNGDARDLGLAVSWYFVAMPGE